MRNYLSNVIIFCGSGRNVGKTSAICELIKHFSINTEIIAIKISPHFHNNTSKDLIIEKSDKYTIYKENQITTKDSSLFLQAGAKEVFYIETSDEFINEAFLKVLKKTGENKIFVVESGILSKFIKPGICVFIESKEHLQLNIEKSLNKKHSDIVLNLKSGYFDKNIQNFINRIYLSENSWKLKL